MVERVAHSIGNGLGPFLESLPGAVLASCQILFAYSVASHCPPFVVVAVVTVHKPELCDVPELDILGYLLGYKMAVIVDDGHFLCMLVIQHLRGIIGEHEIVVDER